MARTPDADVEKLGSEPAIRAHYEDEQRLEELSQLCADLRVAIEGSASEQLAQVLRERVELLAHGERLAAPVSSPLLVERFRETLAEWNELRRKLEALPVSSGG